MSKEAEADIIIIGAGLAGLVAASEAVSLGRRVILLEQEPATSLGGQAFWAFGGLFLVNTPEQRWLGIHDSLELALQDWLGSAAFDRPSDHWPKKWAAAYVNFAAGDMRAWLKNLGLTFVPIVEWAERGGYLATGHGNSVPRFHITWGTGPGLLAPFIRIVKQAEHAGLLTIYYRHRVTELRVQAGNVQGVSGEILEASTAVRGTPSSRVVVNDFSMTAQAVIITSGGIGANHDLVRQYWPERMGNPPENLLSGVPDHVDGYMLQAASQAGANVINMDRMWHYPEGLHHYAPLWNKHAIRVLSGPSPLWLGIEGERLPSPLFPGFDAMGALSYINKQALNYSWLVMNQHILEHEFALSGSDQNPDLATGGYLQLIGRTLSRPTAPVKKFLQQGSDFVIHPRLAGLVQGMNNLANNELIQFSTLEEMIQTRDLQVNSKLGKDMQIISIRAAQRYLANRIFRIASLNKILEPKHGPLIAVRLSLLTRKTLGGLETDLSGRVLLADGSPFGGLYAAGEVCGFGGGGMHGYRALEGTFLGGCLFSGKIAGRSAALATV